MAREELLTAEEGVGADDDGLDRLPTTADNQALGVGPGDLKDDGPVRARGLVTPGDLKAGGRREHVRGARFEGAG